MFKYYYNTLKDNPNNMTLGYVTRDGDFMTISDYNDMQSPQNYLEYVQIKILAEIIAEEGLLSAGETFEEFCIRITKDIYQELTTEN